MELEHRSGIGYLVGAGPGDLGLLTLRALQLLKTADVVLHDRLIPPGILDLTRSDAELIYVGKQPGSIAMPQQAINQLLVDKVAAGKLTVRLKGGDPFMFGRGGEEAQALVDAGLKFEVVPGVTAGIAASAYAGVPITHRGLASAVAFITGHEDPTKPGSDLQWEPLAQFPGTLVFYMGIKQLGSIANRLIAAGRSPQQPVIVVERGTYSNQRSVTAPLAEIAEAVAAAKIRPPALTVIGDVAALSSQLSWLPQRPLSGKKIVVTRASMQATELSDRLRELGADVLQAPLIKLERLPVKLPELSAFDLLCVTSPNAAEILFQLLAEAGLDARALAGVTVSTVGPGTAKRLSQFGIKADIIPERAVAEGLLERLEAKSYSFKRALILKPERSRPVLSDGLAAAGVEVQQLAIYRTTTVSLDSGLLEQLRGADIVTFASSSAASNYLEAVGDSQLTQPHQRVISIGPITTQTLLAGGIRPDVEADPHTVDGLIEATVKSCAVD